MIRKIINVFKFIKLVVSLGNKERTSVYRMIYWKTHWDGIPHNEKVELLKDEWLYVHYDWKGERSYRWTEKSNEIIKLLDDE